MDYHKLDAALIAAMGGAEDIGGARDVGDAGSAGVEGSRQARTYAVFIHTTHPLHDDEASYLKSLGVRGAAPRRRIITATLAAPVIEVLSETTCVRALRLSQTRTLTPPLTPPIAPTTTQSKKFDKENPL